MQHPWPRPCVVVEVGLGYPGTGCSTGSWCRHSTGQHLRNVVCGTGQYMQYIAPSGKNRHKIL